MWGKGYEHIRNVPLTLYGGKCYECIRTVPLKLYGEGN